MVHSFPTRRSSDLVMKQHWEDEALYYGRPFAERSFRKHLLWYTKGLAGSARLRERLGKMTDSNAMRLEVERFFRSLAASQAEIMT